MKRMEFSFLVGESRDKIPSPDAKKASASTTRMERERKRGGSGREGRHISSINGVNHGWNKNTDIERRINL